jgi:uncharacterized protein (DUF433 family)
MIQAKEYVEKMQTDYEHEESILEQLKKIDKLIAQNQAKIWLRTRSGKPLAEKIETTAANVLKQLEKGNEINEILDELESTAKEIDEESQRRSMVVT